MVTFFFLYVELFLITAGKGAKSHNCFSRSFVTFTQTKTKKITKLSNSREIEKASQK
jgi:hypothetical protein